MGELVLSGDLASPNAQAIVPGFHADYFTIGSSVERLSDIDFNRAPDATSVVERLDTDRSLDPFWDGGPTDTFAARYTADLTVSDAGSYTFHLTSDDGSALYIDGEAVIDNDGLHGNIEQQVTLALSAGTHSIEIRYFELYGAQTLQLDWTGPDTGNQLVSVGPGAVHTTGTGDVTPPPPPPPPTTTLPGVFEARYFDLDSSVSSLSDIDFTATPTATGTVEELDIVRSGRPFWEAGPRSYFAAEYTATLKVYTAGEYTFYLTSDDGSALSLDGARIIGNDGLHGDRLETVTLQLEAGDHALELQYFENRGRQTLQLEWSGPDTDG